MHRVGATFKAVMKSSRWWLALLLAATLAGSAVQAAEAPRVRLTVLSTTDFHGALLSESKDPASGRPLGGAAVLATAIAQERQTNPEGALLLDAGDSLHGTALSNLTAGRATVDFMNLVGFDAAAVGNHEFDWEVPVLIERISQAEFPFLVANIIDKETGQAPSWAVPYHVFHRQGVRVAVIGLITTDTPQTTLPRNIAAFEFLDPAPVARQLIEELVPAKADLVVLLCHIGLADLDQVIRSAPGIAAIVAGHTHQTFAGDLHGVPTVQAGDRGMYLGRIDLVFDRQQRQVVESEVRLLEVAADAFPPDPAVTDLLEGHRQARQEKMQEVLAHAESAITRNLTSECAIGNLIADAIRQQSGAALVFQNPFAVRAPLDAGPITYQDVYRVLPFNSTIVIVEMTASEIHELLELAAGDSPNRRNVGRILYVSGLRYTVDLTRSSGSRITVSTPLEDDRTYEVAINSFMAEGGDGLTILAHRPEARTTGVLLRDALVNWLRSETRQGRKINAQVDGRIQVGNSRP